MPFFDKKEDVLDLELTPYGRHLLSKGKLMPKYYSFLDDDVVYDIKHGTPLRGADGPVRVASENNSLIKTRIIDETPSLKPLYTINSVETELLDQESALTDSSEREIIPGEQLPPENVYDQPYMDFRPASDMNTKIFQNTLGTIRQDSLNAPRWKVSFVRGEFENALSHTSSLPTTNMAYSSPLASVVHIPQIECEMTWSMEVKSVEQNQEDYNTDIVYTNNTLYREPTPVDHFGNYLKITDEQAIVDILEKNGFSYDDSFHLEVFEFESTEAGDDSGNIIITETNRLIPLQFRNKQKRIVKDILLDEPYETEITVDPTNVGYYFDIKVDEEIPEADICKGVENLNSQGLYTVDFNIVCPDLQYNLPPTVTLPVNEPCDPCPPEGSE